MCLIIVCDCASNIITEAVVGFDRALLGVGEDQGVAQVCMRIFSPTVDCPVSFPLELIITATDGTAGILQQIPEV